MIGKETAVQPLTLLFQHTYRYVDACLTEFLIREQPKLFLHGHIHRSYGRDIPRSTMRGDTQIVNTYEYTVVEL